MDEARAVEQHVDAADFSHRGVDRGLVKHIEFSRGDALQAAQLRQGRLVDVGGMDHGARAREGKRARLAYALRGGRHQNALSFKIRHCKLPFKYHASGHAAVRRVLLATSKTPAGRTARQ